jgi:membrane protein
MTPQVMPKPGPSWPARLEKRWSRSRLGRLCRAGMDIEIMHRSFSFAALGFTTLVPLLIVVAAATSLRGGGGFPSWVIGGIGLSGRSATAVRQVFTSTGKVMSTTTAVSVVGLAFFGLTMADCVKRGFEHIWDLSQAGLRSAWRQVVWLAVLVGYLLAVAELSEAAHGSWIRTAAKVAATVVSSVLFFWWTAKFLLDGRVSWRPLLPGAVLTMLGLGGLRVTSSVFFAPFIVSGAVGYGAIGTVLILVSWLIGVGFVIFGGALAGRYLTSASPAGEAAGDTHADQGPAAEARHGGTVRM